MKKLNVDLEELVLSFNFDSEGLSKEYFDTETGEVIHIPEEVARAVEDGDTDGLDDWQKELIEDAEAVLFDEENRYVLIPVIESSYYYNAMVDFTNEGIINEKLKLKLNDALDTAHPMKRFKDVLHSYSEELDKWYEYEDAQTKKYILKWLEEQGIIVENK